MAGHESTVVDVINAYRAAGYVADFAVSAGGRVRCVTCGHDHDAADVVIERLARFEGSSDPDDEAIVFALRCQLCAAAGVLVAAYGPTATAEEAAVVTALASR